MADMWVDLLLCVVPCLQACEPLPESELLARCGESPRVGELLERGWSFAATDVDAVDPVPGWEVLENDLTTAGRERDLVSAPIALRALIAAHKEAELPAAPVERWENLAAEWSRMAQLPDAERAHAAEALGHWARARELDGADEEARREAVAAQRNALELAGLCETHFFLDALLEQLKDAIDRGRFDDADGLARRVLTLSLGPVPSDRRTALAARLWGEVLYARGRRVEAVQVGLVALSKELATTEGEAPTSRLANAYAGCAIYAVGVADYEGARAFARIALELSRAVHGPDSREVAQQHALIASTFSLTGHLTAALEHLEHAIRLQRALGEEGRRDLQGSLHNLSALYQRAGRYDDAIRVQSESMAAARELFGTDHPRFAYALRSIALRAKTAQRGDLGRPFARQAKEIFAASGMDALAQEMRILELELHEGEERIAALRDYVEELDGSDATPTARAKARRTLSSALFQGDRFEESLAEARVAHELTVNGGARGQLECTARLAEAMLGVGDFEGAIPALQAVDGVVTRSFERGSGSLASGARVSAVWQLKEVAGLLAMALARSDREGEAFEAIEGVAEATLTELLRASGGESATPRGTEEWIAALAPGEVLVTTIWASTVALVLWVDGASGEVHLSEVVWRRDEVNELRDEVLEVTRRLAAGASEHGASELGRRLFSAELLQAARDARRVFWIPSGPLHGLAIEPLLGPDEAWVVARAPSTAVLLGERSSESESAGAVGPIAATLLADPAPRAATSGAERDATDRRARPRLPGARIEVDAVAAAIERSGGTVQTLVDTDASARELQRAVSRQRPAYLHIAAHGEPGTAQSPYDASLYLAPPKDGSSGGALSLQELLSDWRGRLEGNELTVLSACHSQAARPLGDSWPALSWGFLAAGAPSVVATLWQADDRATSLLMQRFYANLLGTAEATRELRGEVWKPGQPMPKAEALAEAKHWLRTVPAEVVDRLSVGFDERARGSGGAPQEVDTGSLVPYGHPRYWAPFVLIGSPD